jgi:hypothetical protein
MFGLLAYFFALKKAVGYCRLLQRIKDNVVGGLASFSN